MGKGIRLTVRDRKTGLTETIDVPLAKSFISPEYQASLDAYARGRATGLREAIEAVDKELLNWPGENRVWAALRLLRNRLRRLARAGAKKSK